uniref:Integral membrane protein 2 n=2 Tax=Canis lupus familiaris TaxID=9615 RepID=A0A8C0PHD1_CANLF
MVKISFQPAVAGIKGRQGDKAILLTPEERAPPQRYKKGGSVGGVCYLSMGMVVLLMGLVFASVYIYRYFFLAQLARDNFFHCGVLYEDSLSSQARTRMELEEDVKIYLEENYERINVPVPQFGGGDPADIIHDFQRGLTAYHDISLDKCYVIELNTTIVLPPRNFWELLMNVKRDLPPQTYIIQEEMVVTEHVSDKEALGSFIYHLCSGKDTYRLRRRATRRRDEEAKSCNAIRHFENTFVVETLICGVGVRASPSRPSPLPSSFFLFWPLRPSSFPSLRLYFGHLSLDVTFSCPFRPCPPPCTRAVTSRGPTSAELPGPGGAGGHPGWSP